MPTVNEVAIKLLIDGKEYEETLDDFNRRLGRAGAKGQESGGSIKRGFSMAKVGILAAAGAIAGVVAGLTKVVNIASDFQEANNKMLVTFRAMQPEARKMRDELVSAYFLSRTEATKLLSNTGDMLTGFGMTQRKSADLSFAVQKLAADLASFTNAQGGAQAVSEALTKGLLGERESMKTYGIAIDETLIKERLRAKGLNHLTGMALKQAKAEATLELAMEQSKNAIGDLERTSDSYANTKRRVAAATEDLALKLGAVFLPIWNKVLQAVLRFVEYLGEQRIGGTLFATWEIISDFATRVWEVFSNLGEGIWNLLTGNWEAMKENFSNLWSAVSEGWDKTFQKAREQFHEGNRAYDEFLAGNVTAQAEALTVMDEKAVEMDEKEKERLEAKRQKALEAHWAFKDQLDEQVAAYKLARAQEAEAELQEFKRKEKEKAKLLDKSKKVALDSFLNIFQAARGVNRQLFGVWKASAIARAIMDAYAGANKALAAYLPPWNFIAAASVLAQGFFNVAQIRATGYARGGMVETPTMGVLGEQGPEVVAPKKDFIDVVRSGVLGGGSSAAIEEKLDNLAEVFSNLVFFAELDDDGLALKAERGQTNLDVRRF